MAFLRLWLAAVLLLPTFAFAQWPIDFESGIPASFSFNGTPWPVTEEAGLFSDFGLQSPDATCSASPRATLAFTLAEPARLTFDYRVIEQNGYVRVVVDQRPSEPLRQGIGVWQPYATLLSEGEHEIRWELGVNGLGCASAPLGTLFLDNINVESLAASQQDMQLDLTTSHASIGNNAGSRFGSPGGRADTNIFGRGVVRNFTQDWEGRVDSSGLNLTAANWAGGDPRFPWFLDGPEGNRVVYLAGEPDSAGLGGDELIVAEHPGGRVVDTIELDQAYIGVQIGDLNGDGQADVFLEHVFIVFGSVLSHKLAAVDVASGQLMWSNMASDSYMGDAALFPSTRHTGHDILLGDGSRLAGESGQPLANWKSVSNLSASLLPGHFRAGNEPLVAEYSSDVGITLIDPNGPGIVDTLTLPDDTQRPEVLDWNNDGRDEFVTVSRQFNGELASVQLLSVGGMSGNVETIGDIVQVQNAYQWGSVGVAFKSTPELGGVFTLNVRKNAPSSSTVSPQQFGQPAEIITVLVEADRTLGREQSWYAYQPQLRASNHGDTPRFVYGRNNGADPTGSAQIVVLEGSDLANPKIFTMPLGNDPAFSLDIGPLPDELANTPGETGVVFAQKNGLSLLRASNMTLIKAITPPAIADAPNYPIEQPRILSDGSIVFFQQGSVRHIDPVTETVLWESGTNMRPTSVHKVAASGQTERLFALTTDGDLLEIDPAQQRLEAMDLSYVPPSGFFPETLWIDNDSGLMWLGSGRRALALRLDNFYRLEDLNSTREIDNLWATDLNGQRLLFAFSPDHHLEVIDVATEQRLYSGRGPNPEFGLKHGPALVERVASNRIRVVGHSAFGADSYEISVSALPVFTDRFEEKSTLDSD